MIPPGCCSAAPGRPVRSLGVRASVPPLTAEWPTCWAFLRLSMRPADLRRLRGLPARTCWWHAPDVRRRRGACVIDGRTAAWRIERFAEGHCSPWPWPWDPWPWFQLLRWYCVAPVLGVGAEMVADRAPALPSRWPAPTAAWLAVDARRWCQTPGPSCRVAPAAPRHPAVAPSDAPPGRRWSGRVASTTSTLYFEGLARSRIGVVLSASRSPRRCPRGRAEAALGVRGARPAPGRGRALDAQRGVLPRSPVRWAAAGAACARAARRRATTCNSTPACAPGRRSLTPGRSPRPTPVR